LPSSNDLIPYDQPNARRSRDRAPGTRRDVDVECNVVSTSRERGRASRSAPP